MGNWSYSYICISSCSRSFRLFSIHSFFELALQWYIWQRQWLDLLSYYAAPRLIREVNSSGLSRLSNFISVRRSCGKIYHDDFLRKSRVSFLRSDHLWRPAQRRPTTREGKRNRRCVAATQMHALTMANRSLIPRRFRLRPFTAERQLHCGLDNGNTSSKAPKGRQAGFLVRAAFSRSFCVGQALYLESMHLQEKNVNVG